MPLRISYSHFRSTIGAVAMFALFATATAPATAMADDDAVSFRRDIAPLLVGRCEACHGERVAKGDFRLDTFARFVDGAEGDDGYVVAGKPEASPLLELLTTDDVDLRMPKDAAPLDKRQIELVRRWIAQGAKFDGADRDAPLVEIMTPPTHPPAPTVYPQPLPITALAFLGDGEELVVGGYHELTVWGVADGTLKRRIGDVASRTYSLAVSPDRKTIAAASGDSGRLGEVRLFDAASGRLLRTLASFRDSALQVKYGADGRLLAASSADRTIRVFDVATGARKHLIGSHGDAVTSIDFSPDGVRLAAVGLDRAAKIHDLPNDKSTASYVDHTGPLYAVAFSPDGKQVFSSGKEKVIRVWNPLDGKKAADLGGAEGDLLQLLVVGGELFAAGGDKRVRRYTAVDRKPLSTYDGATDWIYALAVHGDRVAAGCYDGTVRVWNKADAKLLLTFMAAPTAAPTASKN